MKGDEAMAHVLKATRGQVGALTRHFERAKNQIGEYIKFSNQEIDTSKSNLNYNLAPEKNQLQFIKERTKEVYCLNRKDVNVMASWVVTLPKTIVVNSEEEKSFFKATYDFLKEKYGEENIVSAYVHKDETTPHLHFAFLPILYDKKKEIYKVSAKEILNRVHLQKFHGELDQYLQKELGRDVGILNEATKEGNKEIVELKQATAKQKIIKLENEYTNLESKFQELQEVFQGALVTEEVISKLQPERTLTGALRGVTIEDIENLKTTALQYHQVNIESLELKEENKLLQQKLASSNTEEYRSQERISTLLRENIKLSEIKEEYQNLTSFLNQLPEEFFVTIKKELKEYNQELLEEQEYDISL